MSNESKRTRHALNRRDFLKVSSGCMAGVAGVPMLSVSSPALGATPTSAYPVMEVARLSELKPGTTIPFAYPGPSSPALLMRLPEAARDGVGKDSTIVAFSILCTHKGCPVSYKAEQGMLICPCHWSTFDPAKGGDLIIGQASSSLPRIELRIEGDKVQAVGVEGLIYGHHTNIL